MWKVKAWSRKQQKEKQARQSGENSQFDQLGRSDRFAIPSDNMGRQWSGFSGRSLLSITTYLFVYNFSYVVIMSFHDSVLIADFSIVLESG